MEATTPQGEMAPAELISHTRRVIEGCRRINESFGYRDDEPTLFEAVTDLAESLLARAEAAERDRKECSDLACDLARECADRIEEADQLKARIAALEAENALLLNGWPGKDQRASVYHTDEYNDPALWSNGIVPECDPGWWVYRGMVPDELGPYGARREAILAYCTMNLHTKAEEVGIHG